MQSNSKHEWFRLSYSNSKRLMIYLSCMLVFGLLSSILTSIECALIDDLSIQNHAILGAIATSLLGSSIFYSRKLYKACINIDMLEPLDDNDRKREFGVIIYFITRPIYSVCFAVFAVITIKSGIHIMAEGPTLRGNFVYVCMVMSFFIGYSSGDFIDGLEKKGKQVVETVINDTGK